MTLKAFWPQLFDGNSPRLLATGMREQLFADIAGRDLPLSHKQVIKCLKSLTRSAGYLSRMKVGPPAMICRVTPSRPSLQRKRSTPVSA
ncbi:conjugal transfer fertility inhibition protein FinO [Klebsiella pneumoniae subsp. ozaenae]|uniref:Conjugal transfer fertility inhibition protein FinO n=1 Tax=Klebsiella pneumoniae subsp. ozaenae TaxID=574 RepID=A0A377YVS4_KLEPO|nr:conjugal transfer fertility inhibition protein FinO [Klebsiella pneumoniae subsp. ozaenae]